MLNTKTNNTNKYLAETSNISNPNLLFNPNLAINQRGDSSYTATSSSSRYSVDRWTVYNCTLDASTKKLSSSDAEGLFSQRFEELLDAGTYTLSFSLSGFTGSKLQLLFISGSQNAIASLDITKDGTYSLTYTSTEDNKIFGVGIWIDKNTSCVFNWAKLERGSIATPYITPDKTTEINRCKRYCQYFSMDTRSAVVNYNTVYFRTSLSPMRTIITISLVGGEYAIRTTAGYHNIDSMTAYTVNYNNDLYIVFKLKENTGLETVHGMFRNFVILVESEIY